MDSRKLIDLFDSFLTAPQSSRKKNKSRSRVLALEVAEPRLLMAGDIGYAATANRWVVVATGEADIAEFIAGNEQHVVRLNGLEQRISAKQFTDIRFEGGTKDDLIRLVDLAATDEIFKSWESKSELTGLNLFVRATGFGKVTATSIGGSNDRAYVYGTEAVDEIFASPNELFLVRPSGVRSSVNGFDRGYVYGYGGEDKAVIEDGVSDDSIVMTETYATIDSPGAYIRLQDIERIQAYALHGGYDKAHQYDTKEADLLVVSEERVRMLSPIRDTEAIGFERNYSYSTNGTSDYVRLYDSVFSEDFSYDTLMEDTKYKNGFEADPNFVRLFSGSFYTRAEGFVVSEILEVNPRYLIGEVSESGAVDVNIAWEQGLLDSYFIEMQRYGSELIMAGLGIGNDAMTDEGIGVIQWGLDRQAADGPFEGSGDPVHSTSLFLQAVGLSIEELERFEYHAFDSSLRMRWLDGLSRMANWLIANDDVSRTVDLEPFTHRYFLRATGLKRAALLTGNQQFHFEADSYLAQGIAKMTADGVLPERDGFDLNYQTLGLRYAGDFYRMTSNTSQRDAIRSLFVASLAWINSRIDSEGNSDMSDSTRSIEDGRDGTAKTFDYRNAVRAYLSGYEITGDMTWLNLANAVFQHDKTSTS